MATKKSSLAPREQRRRSQPSITAFDNRVSFETHVLTSLETQDRLLERLELKLEKPVLNGGFDELVKQVGKIETVSEQLRLDQGASGKKIDAIHVAIYDPDTGLYGRVKEHTQVITRTGKGLNWFIGVLIAAGMTGIGKVMYDFLVGHIHFNP